MWRKTAAAVLVVFGILLIASPFLKESLIGFLSAKYTGSGLTAQQAEKNSRRPADYDFAAVQPPSFYDTVRAAASFDQNAIIGRIQIKRLGINLPILKGTTNANLLVGAATMRADQRMGAGNYPLAGHHMRRENLLFGPLMRAKVNDEIVITDLKKDYVYRVTKTKVVPASNGGVIAQTGDRRITLVTCDKPTRTANRQIVIGKWVRTAAHR